MNERDIVGALGATGADTGVSAVGSAAAMLLGRGKVDPKVSGTIGGLAAYMPANAASNKYVMDRQEKQLAEDHPILDALGVTNFRRPIDRTGLR